MGPPVDATDHAAARARLLSGRPLPSDETLLSHAVSRGVSRVDLHSDLGQIALRADSAGAPETIAQALALGGLWPPEANYRCLLY